MKENKNKMFLNNIWKEDGLMEIILKKKNLYS